MESFTERLIPNLSSNLVAVLDITKYHSSVVEKIFAKSSTKMAMLEDGRPRHSSRQQNAEGTPLQDDVSQKSHTLRYTYYCREPWPCCPQAVCWALQTLSNYVGVSTAESYADSHNKEFTMATIEN